MITALLLKLLILAYASVGIVSAIGYWPTIRDLYYHKKMSANMQSYAIWTACSAISLMYALFILNDLLVRIVTGLNFGCCAIILVLIINLKLKYSK